MKTFTMAARSGWRNESTIPLATEPLKREMAAPIPPSLGATLPARFT